MPRAHKSCKRFARRCDEILLERDALITRLHRISRTDLAIPASNLIRNSFNLITPMLSLGEITAQLTKRLQKERFDVRSEEHTSELQSRGQIVCRLLLEKKNVN